MALKRVSSGIKELNAMIEGGFPEGDIILYSGAPGTGKTVACLQYIADGIAKGEDCIYVASEETRGKLMEHAKLLGFDFEKAVKAKKLEIFQVEDIAFQDPLGRTVKLPREPDKRIERLTAAIKEWMQKCKGKRLVVDSLLVYALSEKDMHNVLLNSEFFRDVDKLGMTTILVSELSADSKAYSRDGVTEALADGIVLFGKEREGRKVYKTLEVAKMRDTKVDDEVKRFDISAKGIKLIK
jgi:KaiC/GvpD/RAD55 family RecA-like ATPase